MQQCFKDLPQACEIQGDIILPKTTTPFLTSVSPEHPCIYQKQGMFCSTSDLNIQNAKLKCEVLRVEKDLLSKSLQLDQEKRTITILEETIRIETQNRQASEDESRNLLRQQLETLTKCQCDLGITEEKYVKICQQEQDIRERCDTLTAKDVLSTAELRRKSDEFSSTLRAKEIAFDGIERRLSEVLSEKAIVEESFRLFKSNILADLDKEGEYSPDNHLMIKIRLLQESNAQLSAEVKSMTRKCVDVDIEMAALKEEISLSDRMKSRLSSSVENQCKEIDILEKKLLNVSQLMLQEQAAREELKEIGRNLELQLMQSKFTNERQENSILDLKETKGTLEKSLTEQLQENERWMERLKTIEQTAHTDQDRRQREYALTFEREAQFEKQNLMQKELECNTAHASLQIMSKTLNAVNEDNKQLQQQIVSLQRQLEHFSEIESCAADIQAELENKEDEIATLCQAFDKRGESMKELEKRISLQASEISFLRPERDSKAKIAKTFEGQLSVLENEKAELLRVSSQNDSRGSLIDDLKMTIMQYEQKLKSITDEKGDLHTSNKELDTLKTDYRVLKDDYEEAEETMVELSKAAADEIERRDKQLHTFKMLVEEKEQAGICQQQEIHALQQSNARLENIIKKAEEDGKAAWFGS